MLGWLWEAITYFTGDKLVIGTDPSRSPMQEIRRRVEQMLTPDSRRFDTIDWSAASDPGCSRAIIGWLETLMRQDYWHHLSLFRVNQSRFETEINALWSSALDSLFYAYEGSFSILNEERIRSLELLSILPYGPFQPATAPVAEGERIGLSEVGPLTTIATRMGSEAIVQMIKEVLAGLFRECKEHVRAVNKHGILSGGQ
jgi:hypothetical protein